MKKLWWKLEFDGQSNADGGWMFSTKAEAVKWRSQFCNPDDQFKLTRVPGPDITARTTPKQPAKSACQQHFEKVVKSCLK